MSKNNGSIDFQGKYVLDIRDVLLASLYSGRHCMLMSEPGWGKTDIADVLATKYYGPKDSGGGYRMMSMEETTSPSAIKGVVDIEKLLDKKPSYQLVTDDTPFDPKMRVVLFDELLRASDPLFGAALHATDPKKQDHAVVWGTSNFVPTGTRVQALLDRFALWLWIEPEDLDVYSLVMAQAMSQGKPTIPGNLPTLKEINDVRAAKPTKKSAGAIAKFCNDLADTVRQEGYSSPHPRQISHWYHVLFYSSVAELGVADFDTIPAKATRSLLWAWPSSSYDEARKWKALCGSMIDKVGTMIDAIMAGAVKQFKKVASMETPQERTAAIPELGMVLSNSQASLQKLGDDPRVSEAETTLNKLFGLAVQGENITL